eukprot:scaffold87516_cov23-Prasinocladus_malaysianus.AAC.1
MTLLSHRVHRQYLAAFVAGNIKRKEMSLRTDALCVAKEQQSPCISGTKHTYYLILTDEIATQQNHKRRLLDVSCPKMELIAALIIGLPVWLGVLHARVA